MIVISIRRKPVRNSFRKPTRKWEDNIKMNLKEVGCDGADQGKHQWQAVVHAVMNIHAT
jgi:hypothetical protein